MMKKVALAVMAVAANACAGVAAPPVTHADSVVPQANSPCSTDFANAMAWPPGEQTPLACVAQPNSGFQWQPVANPFPPSNRWLTYGPDLKLHGEGLRNPEIQKGNWTAVPLDPDSQCRAEQIAVVSAGVVSPPQVSEGAKGQPLSFQVVPKLFSIQMTGKCLWTKADS